MPRSQTWPKITNLNEWVDLDDSGLYLGPSVGSKVNVYRKALAPGSYAIDDTAAFYLFEFKGITP